MASEIEQQLLLKLYLKEIQGSNKSVFLFIAIFPAGINLPKVNNKNSRTRCEICSNLTIKTLERCQWRRSGAFIVNFEHILHLALVFLLLTLNK